MGMIRRDDELVRPDRLVRIHAAVIGCGAIGRQVAIQLATMEVGHLTLVDFDVVEPVNLHNQGWYEVDLGIPKVHALGRLLGHIRSRYTAEAQGLTLRAERYARRMLQKPTSESAGLVVFCCVDNIEIRRLIFDDVKDLADLFIDARMAAEFCQVFTAWDPRSRAYYPTTLFPQGEAYNGRCATQNTIYSSSIAAGLMCHQFARWLRGGEPDLHAELNLLAATYNLEQPLPDPEVSYVPDTDLAEEEAESIADIERELALSETEGGK